MPLINAQLSVEATGGDLVTLMITDAYGHINGRIELNPDECRRLSDHLQTLIPIDVEAVVVEEKLGVDWVSLTKAEIVDKANELFDVLLDADDTEAKLVNTAQGLELQAS